MPERTRSRTRNAGRVLVIEDDNTLNRLLVDQLTRLGFEPRGVTSRKDADRAVGEFEPALALLDMRLPDMDGIDYLPELSQQCPVIILTAFGSIAQAVEAVKAGASEYLVKPVSGQSLELAISRVLEKAELRRSAEFWESRAKSSAGPNIIGESAAIKDVRRMISIVAGADTTVLVLGESGVGKELVAQAVHANSNRADKHFVAIDCASLQETLFESELFGHERGSFTGADRRKEGLIEIADGGTVFLDEIGEISPAIQAKLLRVLETGKFRRLGGTRDLESDVRFVAATNRDLRTMANGQEFRSDLYYRLSPFEILVPPLRERREDIPALAEFFLANRKFSRNIAKQFAPSALKALTRYGWPGNIRELRNVVERAFLISGRSARILPEHISLPEGDGKDKTGISLSFASEPTLDELRDAYVARLMDRHGGNRQELAARLGISERNVYRILARLKDLG
ncbi:MAG: sigma-54 dependent transcriptional regulator [Zhengella sp.]|uniref:sigma-54-dependent transcriptional regulator n=1 Tax=Zhengella sp. TaxID=2282762 RepID=UPI001DB376BE|nr:sigma-54-dependent Fis family transcriptional regulator [Notoacmeibacter sp.]MCC0026426.1 sigma-54-dependent Fis family transcriptional regulator [Brucellaceae bacterium]